MTRNLWSWDQRRDWDHQRAKERAADKVLLRQRIELLDQAERQRKDWRYGLFGEPVKGPPLEPGTGGHQMTTYAKLVKAAAPKAWSFPRADVTVVHDGDTVDMIVVQELDIGFRSTVTSMQPPTRSGCSG